VNLPAELTMAHKFATKESACSWTDKSSLPLQISGGCCQSTLQQNLYEEMM
jgi:hypothetical protein